MPAIGGVSCTFLKGEIDLLTQRVENWETPGIDGVGAQILGLGNAGWQYEAWLIDTLANFQTWRTNILALVGSVVTATDDLGEVPTGLLVVAATVVERRAVIYQGAARVRARIRLAGRKIT